MALRMGKMLEARTTPAEEDNFSLVSVVSDNCGYSDSVPSLCTAIIEFFFFFFGSTPFEGVKPCDTPGRKVLQRLATDDSLAMEHLLSVYVLQVYYTVFST